jgi:hypothetical protein
MAHPDELRARTFVVTLQSMDRKLNVTLLRQLEEDASALLGEHYTKLVAKRTRGFD